MLVSIVAACVLKIKVVGVQASEVVALLAMQAMHGPAPPPFSALSDNIACSLLLQVSSVGSTSVITRLFLLLLSRIIDPDKQQLLDKGFTSYGIKRNERRNRCLVFRLAKAPYLETL